MLSLTAPCSIAASFLLGSPPGIWPAWPCVDGT